VNINWRQWNRVIHFSDSQAHPSHFSKMRRAAYIGGWAYNQSVSPAALKRPAIICINLAANKGW
jgi:hypothetical protein